MRYNTEIPRGSQHSARAWSVGLKSTKGTMRPHRCDFQFPKRLTEGEFSAQHNSCCGDRAVRKNEAIMKNKENNELSKSLLKSSQSSEAERG